MKAILEIEFNPEIMCSKEDLNEFFEGSWYKCIEFLFEEEGIGIFSENFKLIDIKEN